MANFGKRMVAEDLIKQIGQGGGGTEYTAGDGIAISKEDVISVGNTLTGDKTFNLGTNSSIDIVGSTSANLKLGTSTNKVTLNSNGQDLNITVPSLENFYIQNQSFFMGRTRFGVNYTKPAGNYTFATLDDLPAAVSGTNDGTNWTSLTVGTDTYAIPQGGSGGVSADQVIINERYAYTDKPADYSDLASFLAKVPILATNNFTDAETFGHPVIDLTVDTFNQKYAIVTGWFGIRNTANNTVQYYTTATANVTMSSDPTYKDFQIERTGSNDFVIKEARNNGQFTLTDGTTSIDVMRFTRSDFQNVGVGETGITRAELMLRINNPKVNANMPTTTPNTAGTYVLQATVDANGQVSAIEWVSNNQ